MEKMILTQIDGGKTGVGSVYGIDINSDERVCEDGDSGGGGSVRTVGPSNGDGSVSGIILYSTVLSFAKARARSATRKNLPANCRHCRKTLTNQKRLTVWVMKKKTIPIQKINFIHYNLLVLGMTSLTETEKRAKVF